MSNYIKILGVIAYSNSISFEQMVDEYKCDESALQFLISRGVIEKWSKGSSNVVMLSLKGRKLYQSIDSVIDLSLLR